MSQQTTQSRPVPCLQAVLQTLSTMETEGAFSPGMYRELCENTDGAMGEYAEGGGPVSIFMEN